MPHPSSKKCCSSSSVLSALMFWKISRHAMSVRLFSVAAASTLGSYATLLARCASKSSKRWKYLARCATYSTCVNSAVLTNVVTYSPTKIANDTSALVLSARNSRSVPSVRWASHGCRMVYHGMYKTSAMVACSSAKIAILTSIRCTTTLSSYSKTRVMSAQKIWKGS